MVSQADRRAGTRAVLIEASIAGLIELGLAGYTVNDIVTRSGLSNGALYRYFPTKTDLLAATIQELLVRSTRSYRAQFAAIDPAEMTVERALWVMWDIMTAPEFAAVLDTYAAARTDPVLSEAMTTVLAPCTAEHRNLAKMTFVQLGYPEEYAAPAAILAVNAIQGLAIVRDLISEKDAPEILVGALTWIATTLFDMPPG